MISVWPSSASKTYSCRSTQGVNVEKKSHGTSCLNCRERSRHSPCCMHPLLCRWKALHPCPLTVGRRPPSAFAAAAVPSPSLSIQAAPEKSVKLFNASAPSGKKNNSVCLTCYLQGSFIIADVQVFQIMQGISFNWCELLDKKFIKYLLSNNKEITMQRK